MHVRSARASPSSLAARPAVRSPEIKAAKPCRPRIWASVHSSPAWRASAMASVKYGRPASARRPAEYPAPSRARPSRAGSPSSRARATASSACVSRGVPVQSASRAASASARTRTSAAMGSAPPGWAARTASNQARPSSMRHRPSQSGCSEDVSRSAVSASDSSRLQPNAARRLSMSASSRLINRRGSPSAGGPSRAASAA